MISYYNNFISIDLSRGEINFFPLKEKIFMDYIGGSGIASYLLAKIIIENEKSDSLNIIDDPPLIFSTGSFCGTKVPSSDRLQAVSISPLTKIFSESDVGGKIASRLHSCGYDGIILKGRLDKLSYILISDKGVEIHSCQELSGKDTYQVYDYFSNKYNNFSIMSIGKAGENMVKYSSIMVGGRASRAFGRAGFGAIMGKKNIKSIVILKGEKKSGFENNTELNKKIKESIPLYMEGSEGMRDFGTAIGVNFALDEGDYPIKNWQWRSWNDKIGDISGEKLAEDYLTGRYYCGNCVIGCGREIKSYYEDDKIVAGPEYETIGLLGSNLLLDDLDFINKANELCNKEGLDTISTGNLIGLVLELSEKGKLNLLGDLYSDDIYQWGNGEDILKLIDYIINRTNIGKILAEGTRYISEHYDIPEELNIQVKGLEPPAHDPRLFPSLYLGYATSNRRACHLQGYTHALEGFIPFPEIGFEETLSRKGLAGKPLMTMRMQDVMSLFDSLKICKFMIYTGVPFKRFYEWYKLLNGVELNLEDFLMSGTRIFNLKRMINIYLGINRSDDRIPKRFFKNTNNGIKAEEFEKYLSEYYSLRNWNQNGIPGLSLVKELGLGEFRELI
jgi:aldehyde:ferredoxin oxidoreductase